MTTTVRFAPSPTGLLHVGNARTALINALFARHAGGRFLLRLDDTDVERCEPRFAEAIERDLLWLGLRWDALYRQSERLDAYNAAFERLKSAGRLYPCYETPEELEFQRRRRLARGLPPIYDRAALALTDADRQALEAEGRKPHWRFRLDHAPIAWDDLVRGPVHFDGTHLSDPVLVRSDGSFLYMLPSVVDDIDMNVTHVVRGEDHVSNTAVQVQIFAALGARPPAFAHLPLLADATGAGLSKRLGSLSVESLRDDGIEPMALNGYLAGIGTGAGPRLARDIDALAADFDIAGYGRATPRYDPVQLAQHNARYLHETPFAEIAGRLRQLGLNDADETFWNAVRANLETLADARVWYAVCHGEIAPVIDDAAFAATARRLLPDEPWNETTWKGWTDAVKAETGRKGKALFQPLRLALTGMDHGPELKALLPRIGRERALARLAGHADATQPV